MKKSQKNLFIATSSFANKNFKIINKLKKNNIKFILNPLGRKLKKKEISLFAKNCTHIIAGTEIYDEMTLKELTNLKMIFRLGSGIDNIDLKQVEKKKIKILKTKVSLEKAVGELTIALILNVLRKISNHNQNMKNGIWKKEMGNLLYDKTVGIIGYGKVGKYLSRVLRVFGAKILTYDIKKNNHNVTLKNLLINSDIITIHSSYTKKNFNFINKEKMKLMRKDSILINTSRPEIIDYEYLYYLLKKKKIKGAALDVYKKEPYKGKFSKLRNVLLTPHIGSYAQEIRDKMELDAVESVIKY